MARNTGFAAVKSKGPLAIPVPPANVTPLRLAKLVKDVFIATAPDNELTALLVEDVPKAIATAIAVDGVIAASSPPSRASVPAVPPIP